MNKKPRRVRVAVMVTAISAWCAGVVWALVVFIKEILEVVK